jgi:hypothetical protein
MAGSSLPRREGMRQATGRQRRQYYAGIVVSIQRLTKRDLARGKGE